MIGNQTNANYSFFFNLLFVFDTVSILNKQKHVQRVAERGKKRDRDSR